MTTASSAAAVGIRQARLACKLESHGDGTAFCWVPKPANIGVRPWASAIPRFKRRCSDRDGNTRSKSKAGRSGKGSCTDCRTVLYASPNHKLENFNERNRLVSTVTAPTFRVMQKKSRPRPNGVSVRARGHALLFFSPYVAPLLRCPHHGRVGFAAERLLEFRQVGERTDDTVFPNRVRIRLHHDPLFFNANGIAAPLSPCNEELLFWSESVDVRRARLAFEGLLEGEERDFGAAEVADALTQHQFAIVVNAGLDEVVVELIHYAGAALLELLQIAVRPPVSQAPLVIVLRALVVEAMRNLMADDHPDRAVVDGVGGVVIKARRLQDAGGENDLVPERVVVGVRGRRRHAPAAAVHRSADCEAVVFHDEMSAGEIVFEESTGADIDRAVVLPVVGIADLGIEGGDLGHRSLLGLVAHPRAAENVVPHSQKQVPHHLLRARLGLRREIFFRIPLAQGFTQELIGGFHATLPAGLYLCLAAQVLAEESEILLDDGS